MKEGWKTWLSPEILRALSEPFPEAEIGWKAQAFNSDKTRALAVPHITARHVMNRLDEVVGAWKWTTDFEMIVGIKAAKVMLTVFGVTKSDIGFVAGDDDAAIKGSVSDGLKRAAVLFGIGRYLYESERQWVDWDSKRRQFAETPKLILKKVTSEQAQEMVEESKKRVDAALDEVKPVKEKPEKATIGLIQEEANAQLEAMGMESHYKTRVQTIRAMEACGYKGTAQKYLSDNFSDIVACLIDRVKESDK